MAVKAAAEATITDETDLDSLVTWYRLTSGTTPPSAPSTTQTSASVADWSVAEPSFDPSQGTMYLYTVQQTRWKDGSCSWGTVQLSSSYEQAKQAWNKANAAAKTATKYITDVTNGIMVHPDGDQTTGWKITDALELLKGGVSMLKAWAEDQMVKVRVGLLNAGHVTLESDGVYVWKDQDIVAGMQRNGDVSELYVGQGQDQTVLKDGAIWFKDATTGECGPAWALCGGYGIGADHYDLYNVNLAEHPTIPTSCSPTSRYGTLDVTHDVVAPGQVSADHLYELRDRDGVVRIRVFVDNLGSGTARRGLSPGSYVVRDAYHGTTDNYEISVWARGNSDPSFSEVSSEYAGKYFAIDYLLFAQSYQFPMDGLKFSVGEGSCEMVMRNRRFYPMFVYAAFPTTNGAKDESQLPVTPCFVLDTSDCALYYCSGT